MPVEDVPFQLGVNFEKSSAKCGRNGEKSSRFCKLLLIMNGYVLFCIKKTVKGKLGCLIAVLGLGWLGYVLWPEPEAPLRTDVEPLQRRLALDGGISSAQWRARQKYDNGWGLPVQDNYIIITGLAAVPAVADMFAAVGDVQLVEVRFEGESLAAQESAALLARLNARMQERGDKELKPCQLKRFAWLSQRNLVYIELECR